jgi:prolyl-tRNA synthetase
MIQKIERAKKVRDEHIVKVSSWADFMKGLAGKNMCLCSWCEDPACEEEAKKRSQKESAASKSDEQVYVMSLLQLSLSFSF